MQNFRGMRAHAKMFPGATYEKRASFFAIDMVLIANVNLMPVSSRLAMAFPQSAHWYSWQALGAIDMNELVKTVMNMVLIHESARPVVAS
jgi:hypothetical protein